MFRRRKHGSQGAEPEVPTGPESEPAVTDDAEGKTPRPSGPFDINEVDATDARHGRIDLGGMLVPAAQGLQVQLQLDKRSGQGTTALLRIENAAVQLIAIAAPRSSGMWDQTRLQIIEDAKRRGGSAEEASGPFGVEVRAIVPMTTPEGKRGRQPSRVSGIDGPRWMLRATFLGSATSDASVFQRMVDLVQGVVVVRGDRPMPPGDVIVLTPPPSGDPASAQVGVEGGVTSQTPES